MNIRTRFRLTVCLTAILLLLGVVCAGIGMQQSQKSIREAIRYGNLVDDLHELRDIGFDYRLHPTDRAREQWQAVYERIRREIVGMSNLANDVKEAVENLKSVFDGIIENSTDKQSDPLQLRYLEQQFANLDIETQRIHDWASTIRQNARNSFFIMIKSYSTGSVAILVLVSVIVISVISMVGKRLLSSIIQLKEGTKIIASGQLAHRIEKTGNDEISQLADDFNVMSEKLKITYEDLHLQTIMMEEEIAHRQIVQEDLAVKQQQLEEMNSTLENRITDAVTEIRQMDGILIQQSRFNAMGNILNSIAHQWRQPLNNIGLILQNIKSDVNNGKVSPKQFDNDVCDAMKNIQYLSNTIDDFLGLLKKDIEKQKVPIINIVSQIVNILDATHKGYGIKVTIQADEDVTAWVYLNEYAQVLLNIINNARETLLERRIAEPEICIRVFCDHGISVLTVTDNAGGIEDEVLPKIFDPYFTTKFQRQGKGIALYMSKVIIEQNMGGHLRATNSNGGAEFRIEVE
jgi:signal transduction histidine kinase